MNERLKELARQAKLSTANSIWLANDSELERFAQLVRDDERDKCAQDYLQDCCDAVDVARLEEREVCAKLCEELGEAVSVHLAATIRARGDKHE